MGIPESLEYFFLAVLLGVIVFICWPFAPGDSEGGSAHLLVVRSLLLCVLVGSSGPDGPRGMAARF